MSVSLSAGPRPDAETLGDPEVPRVPVLEIDTELAAAVHPDRRALATRYALAPAIRLGIGPWVPDQRVSRDGFGYLVLDGLMTREAAFAGRATTELLGEGDLLRPWDHDAGGRHLAMEWSWTVIQPAHLALLDRRFASVVARWPTLVDEIIARALRRARTLAFQLTLTQVKRVEDRLVLLMWALAERWGRVSPQGVVLPMRLTHEVLAGLVGARRPTVTTALGRLSRSGRLERVSQGWLLPGDAPGWVSDI